VPTYEYRCPNGHDFERFFKTMSTAELTLPCPKCGAVAERLISAGAGFSFKGSGFYLTDYGKNAHRKPEPEKKAAGDAGKSDTGKSDTGKSDTGKSDSGKSSEGTPSSSDAKPKMDKPAAPPSKPKSE